MVFIPLFCLMNPEKTGGRKKTGLSTTTGAAKSKNVSREGHGEHEEKPESLERFRFNSMRHVKSEKADAMRQDKRFSPPEKPLA
jgi:hypothetical protein